MKTTFKQYLQEATIPKAESADDLLRSVKAGKFTKDGSNLALDGDFSCWGGELVSLKGAPKSIGENFNCSKNKLTSLEGAPTFVGGNFHCGDNSLISLKDIHKHISEIKGEIYLENNQINSHVLGLLKIKNLKKIKISNNKKVEIIINKFLPEGDIFACQQELIDAGFEEYAKL